MESRKTNPFNADWEKEIESKSFEELAIICANKENYNPEFAEMAEQKLKQHSDYNEEALRAITESEESKGQEREEQEEQKISGWLGFFLVYLIIGGVASLLFFFLKLSPQTYGYKLPLMWSDIVTAIGVSILAGYTFVALYKRWPNAIHLTRFYLGLGIFLNAVSFLLLANKANPINNFTFLRVGWGIVIAVIWLLYFANSKRIMIRYPEEERRWLKNDKYILGAIIIFPLLLFIWGLFSRPSISTSSVTETKDMTNFNQESLLINEKGLGNNEITDGLSIITVPDGIKSESVDLGSNQKMCVLVSEKNESDFEIRIVSSLAKSFSPVDFSDLWTSSQDSTMLAFPYEVTADDVIDINTHKCYRKVVKYKSDFPVIWDFSVLYDYQTNKVCLISAWCPEKVDMPIEDIIRGIKFKGNTGTSTLTP